MTDQEVRKVNAEQLLKKTNANLKNLLLSASKIMTDTDSFHKVISDGVGPTELELHEN